MVLPLLLALAQVFLDDALDLFLGGGAQARLAALGPHLADGNGVGTARVRDGGGGRCNTRHGNDCGFVPVLDSLFLVAYRFVLRRQERRRILMVPTEVLDSG